MLGFNKIIGELLRAGYEPISCSKTPTTLSVFLISGKFIILSRFLCLQGPLR